MSRKMLIVILLVAMVLMLACNSGPIIDRQVWRNDAQEIYDAARQAADSVRGSCEHLTCADDTSNAARGIVDDTMRGLDRCIQDGACVQP